MIAYAPPLGPVRLTRMPFLGQDITPSSPVVTPSSVPVMQAPTSSSSSSSGVADLLLGLAVPAVIVAASVGVSAYHGYKRNRSTGWAVWWGFMGLMFPVLTPVVAIAQGFGKREKK